MRETSWAGVTFTVLGRHDTERVRAPGLYVFAARDGARSTMIFAGEAQDIAREVGPHHPEWTRALALGFNEVHVCLGAAERIDRLQLLSRIVRAEGAVLDVESARAAG
ncbi:MAG: hypothetical protein JSR86_07740 [Proteobacteria bacterium]|nr:hypothetical protein [Pseudomonadota bacterium]